MTGFRETTNQRTLRRQASSRPCCRISDRCPRARVAYRRSGLAATASSSSSARCRSACRPCDRPYGDDCDHSGHGVRVDRVVRAFREGLARRHRRHRHRASRRCTCRCSCGRSCRMGTPHRICTNKRGRGRNNHCSSPHQRCRLVRSPGRFRPTRRPSRKRDAWPARQSRWHRTNEERSDGKKCA